MKFSASLTPTQALRIVPGSLPYSLCLCHGSLATLVPRQSRGPGKSKEMVNALAHRLVGGRRFYAKRPMATATRIAPGTTNHCFEVN